MVSFRHVRWRVAAVVAAVLTMATMPGNATKIRPGGPTVIGHRGASGYLPEHTLGSYALAIEMGADYIEPDLVMTKDGVLVARHENEISGTTDVADHPEFASRRAIKTIDGVTVSGWFTEDFTLAELKTLRAVERLPELRPANTRFNGDFEIPTLMQVLDLVRGTNQRFSIETRRNDSTKQRIIGVYPETKHPSYFAAIGLPMEASLVASLHGAGLDKRGSPVFIQSFEVRNLRALRQMTRLQLIQLMDASDKPYDFVVSGDPRSYADLTSPANLAEIATYADGIGVNKAQIIPRDAAGRLMVPTPLIENAHAAGLLVHGWTFRAENTFLPADLRSRNPADPAAFGDLEGEITTFLRAGMDGFFTDMPDLGDKARSAFVAGR